MYTRYLTIIMMLTFIRVNSLTLPKKFNTNCNVKPNWEPINFQEYIGYKQYQNSRQVKEQSIKYYDKLRTEDKLQKYINKPYKYSK